MAMQAMATIPGELKAQPDLLFMRSILVSTGENKNDDVFLPEEMWNARSTPILKPVDWEHNTGREATAEEQILEPNKVVVDNQTIGVMYNSYVVNKDGESIQTDASESPTDFHIVDEAVIWKALYPSVAKRIEKGAQDGSLFVSMEAWFTDYHYLVGNKVVARNEETAFLDPFLKANGGTGVYENSRVRRVLRNITFGGKGIVSRPANEPSVITDVSHEPMTAAASENEHIENNTLGDLTKGSESRKDLEMADKVTNNIPLEVFQQKSDELSDTKASLKAKDSELAKASEQAEALQGRIDTLENILSKGGELLEEVLPGLQAKVAKEGNESFFSVLSTLIDEQLKTKAEVEKELSEAKASLEKAELDARLAARGAKIDTLLGLGAKDMKEEERKKKKEKKEKMMAAVREMSDEAFEALYETWSEEQESLRAQSQKDEEGKKKKKEEEAEAGESSGASLKDQLTQLLASVKEDDEDFDESLKKEVASVLKNKGRQGPSDEENLANVLENVKASEETPPAGEAGSGGLDLVEQFSSIADLLVPGKKE